MMIELIGIAGAMIGAGLSAERIIEILIEVIR